MPNFKALTLGECPLGSLTTSHQDLGKNFEGSTVLQCQLYNTMYRTDLNYTNGKQAIKMDFLELEQARSVDTLAGFFFNNGEKDCAKINKSNKTCVVDPVTLQRLSYQAVMDAVGRVLVGSVHNGDINEQSTYVVSTNVLSTPLTSTRELGFLSKDTSWTTAGDSLFANSSAEVASLFMNADDKRVQPLSKDMLEELFRNITISMLSSSALQANTSSAFAPLPVNVTFNTYAPTYIYAVKTLWLAYGIAILFSMIGVIIGLCCISSTVASFSNDFSAVFRAARQATVSVEMKETDGDGRDPLPNYLKEATVGFGGGIWNADMRSLGTTNGQMVAERGKGLRLFRKRSDAQQL